MRICLLSLAAGTVLVLFLSHWRRPQNPFRPWDSNRPTPEPLRSLIHAIFPESGF